MPSPTFALFQTDGTTEVAIPQPSVATWDYTKRGQFADGAQRTSALATVEWRYKQPMDAADYQKFAANRSARLVSTFRTWRKPIASTPAGPVKVRGVMEEVIGGTEREGEYYGVLVRWTLVSEV